MLNHLILNVMIFIVVLLTFSCFIFLRLEYNSHQEEIKKVIKDIETNKI